MKTLKEFQEIIFAVENGKVKQMTYKQFVRGFADETNTPNGISARLFHQGSKEDGYDAYTWGKCGNNLRQLNAHFDTEEEAEVWLLSTFENDMEKSSENINYFDTEKEAEDFIILQNAEILEKEISNEEAVKKATEEFYQEKKEREEKAKIKTEKLRVYWLPENVEKRKVEHDEKEKKTKEEFPKLKEKFLAYFERKKISLPLTNKEANAIALKKQNWIEGGADASTLRAELKDWIRNISK